MTSRARVSPNSMIDSMSSALLVLDHLVLGRRLDDAEQLLLRHERTLLQALARQQHVGEADQAAGDEPQRRERHERRGVVRAVMSAARSRVQHGPRLGQRLGQHEEHDHVQDEADEHTDRAEQPVGQDRGEERLPRLQDGDHHEQRVDEPLRVLDQRHRAAVAFDGCSSASVTAFTLEMRLSAVSATAR